MEKFIELLQTHGIQAVCDVRSAPFSKYAPQFNVQHIRQDLSAAKIRYVYLGKELGPRTEDPACHGDGKIDYTLLARTEKFQKGLARVQKGALSYKIALMCAEKDPMVCHRTILVCRHLKKAGLDIVHILENGGLESNGETERRLMKMLKIPELGLFDTPEDLVQRAYDIQGRRIAPAIDDPEGREEEER